MIDLKQVRFVGFDADDTLWDFPVGSLRALGCVVAELNQLALRSPTSMTVERLEAIRADVLDKQPDELALARGRWAVFGIALEEVGLPNDLTKRIFDVYMANRSRPSDRYADTNDVLERLHAAGYRLGLMTNGNGVLSDYGVPDVFELDIRSEEIGFAKPDERFFKIVQERAGLDPQQMLLVGDNLHHDVQGAQDAGWNALWLNQHHRDAPEWVQRPSINRLSDLIHILS